MIPKLKKENLLGRSGSDFPVYLKWKKIKSSKEKTKYIICNASEGDPQTKKDYYLLKKYLKDIINGIEIAIKELEVKTAYIYINKKYYDEFKEDLIKLTINLPIELVRKPEGYLKGEETVIINIIEEKPAVPKIKPPYPTEQGLFEKPTLIHNVETFYCISKIYKNEYKKERFYYVNNKTFKLKDNSTVKEILTNTKNFPKFDFFVQVGGISGEILLEKELNQPINGLGSIKIFNGKTNILKLMKEYALFFVNENCDSCVPCREGMYRIKEILENNLDRKALNDIFLVMEKTSLCPLGKNIPIFFKSCLKKLLK